MIFLIFLISIAICIIYLVKYGYLICDSNVCLVGKTALVTGGSSGIGYQIILSLASRGCRVILADKNVDENIKKSIIEETDNPNITLEYVDMASFRSVRQLVENLKQTEEKLDILINNVGIVKCGDTPTEDGLNMVMQINYYSPFLLTHLLVDLLKKSDKPRIIFTSTLVAFIHVIFPSSISSNEIKQPPIRFLDYGNSKFCTIVASDIFSEKLKKSNITCNTYHPGVAKTNLMRQVNQNISYTNVVDLIIYLFFELLGVPATGNDAKTASQTAVQLAISKEYKDTSGIFYGRFCPNLKPRGANNKKMCEAIWKASENIVKLKQEEKLI